MGGIVPSLNFVGAGKNLAWAGGVGGIVPSLVGNTSFAFAGGVGGMVPSLKFVERTSFAWAGGWGGGYACED